MYRPMRDRNVQLITQASQMLIGLKLFIATSASAVTMSPEVYGDLAYSIEAESWALLFITTSSFYTAFIYINGRWKYSPLMRLLASLTLVLAHAVIGVSSYLGIIQYGYDYVGYPIAEYSVWFFVPLYLYFSWVNLADHKWRML